MNSRKPTSLFKVYGHNGVTTYIPALRWNSGVTHSIFTLQAPSFCSKEPTTAIIRCLQQSYHTMSPQSTAFSLIAIVSFFSSSIALPLDIPQILPRSYSIVNVDGSSSPTTPSTPPAVTQTQTIVNTVTAPGATPIATAPGTTTITTVNVDSATEIVYVTVAPTSTPMPQPTPSAPLSIPYGVYPSLNSTTSMPNCTCSSPLHPAVIPLGVTTSKPTPEVVGDGAPGRPEHTASPTGAYPTAYATGAYSTAYATGSYSKPFAARPSGMTAPLPVLPRAAPYWFNATEISNARRRDVVS